MNKFARRDEIMKELRKEARGSFPTIYRALKLTASKKGETWESLDKDEVVNEIRDIRKKASAK